MSGRPGAELAALSPGDPGDHQVVGVIDELEHFISGNRAVERDGVRPSILKTATSSPNG